MTRNELYPTSNQDRQMMAVRHTQHAMPAKPHAMRLQVAKFTPETVRIPVADPLERRAVAQWLRQAGFAVAIDRTGVAYSEVVRHA